MTIQDQLNALRRKVETLNDPRVASLREVLREQVLPTRGDLGRGASYQIGYDEPVYITRDVRDWPEWAVKGLVLGPALTSMVLGADEVIRHFAFKDAATCIAAVGEAVEAMMEVKP